MAEDEITLPLAAAMRGVNLRTLQAAVKKGVLSGRKLGRDWVTTPAALDEWRDEAKHRPGPAPRTQEA